MNNAPNIEGTDNPSVLAGGVFGSIIQSQIVNQVVTDLNVTGTLTVQGQVVTPGGGGGGSVQIPINQTVDNADPGNIRLQTSGVHLAYTDENGNQVVLPQPVSPAGGTGSVQLADGAGNFTGGGHFNFTLSTDGADALGLLQVTGGGGPAGSTNVVLGNGVSFLTANADESGVQTLAITGASAVSVAGNISLGSMGANTLGFFGAAGASQQTVTFASASPTLTGVYATDVTALQGTLDNLISVINGLLTQLEAYNLVTD